MTDPDDVMLATTEAGEVRLDRADELPVVARLVVEIRSDGTRTVARGALDDRVSGQQVAIKAEGASPLALSLELARALVSLPSMAIRSPTRRLRPSLRKAIAGVLSRRRRRSHD